MLGIALGQLDALCKSPVQRLPQGLACSRKGGSSCCEGMANSLRNRLEQLCIEEGRGEAADTERCSDVSFNSLQENTASHKIHISAQEHPALYGFAITTRWGVCVRGGGGAGGMG